jgi:hypothetical protein
MPFSPTLVRTNVRDLAVDLASTRRNALTCANAFWEHAGCAGNRAVVISVSNQRATKVKLERYECAVVLTAWNSDAERNRQHR